MTAIACTTCFHCGEPLRGSTLSARIGGYDRNLCCHGCLAVAELIAGAGLGDYYRWREQSGVRPDASNVSADTWEALSRPDVAAQYIRTAGEIDSVTFAVDGLRCAACSWLIDRMLRTAPGIVDATTNAATGRTHVRWRRGALRLGDVARTIARLGHVPHPLGDESALEAQQNERRHSLKRLAVAGFGMMQVMMFAVAVYSAELAQEVIDPTLLTFFRAVSLLVATPVMFYAGAPVFASAWRSVRTRALGMDVPVAIALLLAYGASVYNTLTRGDGEVYFDSVTMFIFFLTLGRFVQMTVRHRTTSVSDALVRQLPASAHRVGANGIDDVPLTALAAGDIVLVRPGEVLPVDGDLLDREARIDEAILTGESAPVRKRTGDRLAAGTLNAGNPLNIKVTAVSAGTTLAHIVSLLQQAQARRPALTTAADAAASKFLWFVLLGAGLTCAAWLVIDPSRAFAATLAVLVVACPCAFAIATPAAVSAATAHLARRGLLVTRPDSIETLARVDRIVLDKTGTLTRGEIAIRGCVPFDNIDEQRCLAIAAALEAASEHPLARAFARFASQLRADDVRTFAGAGVEGAIHGRRYRIGSANFVAELHERPVPPIADLHQLDTIVVLGDEDRALCYFALGDVPRDSAAPAMEQLEQLQVSAQVLSGDSQLAVEALAKRCGIEEYFARCSPQQKLDHVRELQQRGHRVAMVGDGVNDAPVLAGADISIAMGRGAAVAHASADMILVTDDLPAIPAAVRLARRTLRIARQNLAWSAVYNFGSLPLAAAGLIPPWIAALGMSLSSSAVVLNASRLLPARRIR